MLSAEVVHLIYGGIVVLVYGRRESEENAASSVYPRSLGLDLTGCTETRGLRRAHQKYTHAGPFFLI